MDAALVTLKFGQGSQQIDRELSLLYVDGYFTFLGSQFIFLGSQSISLASHYVNDVWLFRIQWQGIT